MVTQAARDAVAELLQKNGCGPAVVQLVSQTLLDQIVALVKEKQTSTLSSPPR